MSAAIIALIVVAAVVIYAIVTARQAALMAAVVAYATVVWWIIRNDMGMLMAALVVAIVLGILGLARLVWREVSSQDDTLCSIKTKMSANSQAVVENIGS